MTGRRNAKHKVLPIFHLSHRMRALLTRRTVWPPEKGLQREANVHTYNVLEVHDSCERTCMSAQHHVHVSQVTFVANKMGLLFSNKKAGF